MKWTRCRSSTAAEATIEAVVDRMRIRPDAAQRLAESFENRPLRLSAGSRGFVFLESEAREGERVSGERLARMASRGDRGAGCAARGWCFPAGTPARCVATACRRSRPKLFSFNTLRRLPELRWARGAGILRSARVVLHPHLSLAGGAVRGWDRAQRSLLQPHPVRSRAIYGFDIETPWTELPGARTPRAAARSGAEVIEFSYREDAGRRSRKRHAFEGDPCRTDAAAIATTESPMVPRRLGALLRGASVPGLPGHAPEPRGGVSCSSPGALCGARHLNGRPAALEFLGQLNLPGWRGEVAAKIVKGVVERLRFLTDVGLDYLTLDRSAETLSGGESQRIRLASQVGSGLTGVMYILDEPSIGLHQRDNRRLLATLKQLRDPGTR